jgi:hypothetical protein
VDILTELEAPVIINLDVPAVKTAPDESKFPAQVTFIKFANLIVVVGVKFDVMLTEAPKCKSVMTPEAPCVSVVVVHV